jgi:hypothetical protein
MIWAVVILQENEKINVKIEKLVVARLENDCCGTRHCANLYTWKMVENYLENEK